jgi:nuclear protein localization protein 4 homolog
MITIRINSSLGTRRVEVLEKDTVAKLYRTLKQTFENDHFILSRTRNVSDVIRSSRKHIKNDGIKHGDMIFLIPTDSNMTHNSGQDESNDANENPSKYIEDDIDQILSKMDGKIQRQPGQNCNHGLHAKCIHCVPLEPFDEEYLGQCDPPIKFMSFHTYLRKLTRGQTESKLKPLDNINCHIKPGCKDHLPWPQGICTKCQPPTITLDIQNYRHVDNIMFENSGIVEDFLGYWRENGNQRIGIMLGYYTTFDQSPLGIKAVVCDIYEPKQMRHATSSGQSIDEMLPSSVKEVCKNLRLQPVGWIFTDLKVDNQNTGTVKHYRGTSDTYFLTAEECITAAHFQNMFPNTCTMSSNGYFGSKFVTVVVTGDVANSIHLQGYQVSNQCMSLVKDDILFPTIDSPELAYIRESSISQYVPDVLYNGKDDYHNIVSKIARPLPIEFLIVPTTVTFPKEEQHFFAYRRLKLPRFAIENREDIKEVQSVESIISYLNVMEGTQVEDALSNLHVLLYLNDCEELPLKRHVKDLCSFFDNKRHQVSCQVTNNDFEKFTCTPEWKDFLEMGKKVIESSQKNYSSNFDKVLNCSNSDQWSCLHCTFINIMNHQNCQLCALPRNK